MRMSTHKPDTGRDIVEDLKTLAFYYLIPRPIIVNDSLTEINGSIYPSITTRVIYTADLYRHRRYKFDEHMFLVYTRVPGIFKRSLFAHYALSRTSIEEN